MGKQKTQPPTTKTKPRRTDPTSLLRVYLLTKPEPCPPEIRAAIERNKPRSKVANVRCNGASARLPAGIRDGEGVTGSAAIVAEFCSNCVGCFSAFTAAVIVDAG